MHTGSSVACTLAIRTDRRHEPVVIRRRQVRTLTLGHFFEELGNRPPDVTLRDSSNGLRVAVESFDQAYSRADNQSHCPAITYSIAIGFVLQADAALPEAISVGFTPS